MAEPKQWKRLKAPPEELPKVAQGHVWVADVQSVRDLKRNQAPSPTAATQMDRIDRFRTLYGDGLMLQRARGPRFSLRNVPDDLSDDSLAFCFRPGSPALELGIAQPVSIKEVGLREPYRGRLRAEEKLHFPKKADPASKSASQECEHDR